MYSPITCINSCTLISIRCYMEFSRDPQNRRSGANPRQTQTVN